MSAPEPVLVASLFAPLLEGLIELLGSLDAEEWERPTVNPQWSVKDMAAHLLGGDVSILSRHRDRFLFSGDPFRQWNSLVELINHLNTEWVAATGRLSPRLLVDMLRFTGEQATAFFQTIDPYELGGPVSWAGNDPAPNWLDLAREYTERWHHQQQIRDAVGKPGFNEPAFMAPVLRAFVFAWPVANAAIVAPEGTLLKLQIAGEAGGEWFLRREPAGWQLHTEVDGDPACLIQVDQEIAWRLFCRDMQPEQAAPHFEFNGDRSLAEPILQMKSVIV
ncbi:MAG: maleylpyruvate isomerase N-terminal domain-containing protein [Anaerolineales bacterium]|nr:maleylpyruvate isomerase N-terminal domain-containing protein [Anaerolineales bacterium]